MATETTTTVISVTNLVTLCRKRMRAVASSRRRRRGRDDDRRERLATGSAIHRYADTYEPFKIRVFNTWDVLAINLINLKNKLADLTNRGRVRELPIVVPLADLVSSKSQSRVAGTFVVGVVDAVRFDDGGQLVVEELKTHERVSIRSGRPLVSTLTAECQRLQVSLYAFMIRAFFGRIWDDSSTIRRRFVGGGRRPRRFCSSVRKLMAPCETLDELYDETRRVVVEGRLRRVSTAAAPPKAFVIHVSQTLGKRAISLGINTVAAARERVSLDRAQLEERLERAFCREEEEEEEERR